MGGARPAEAATPTGPEAEAQFLNLLNQERAAAGRAPMVADPVLADIGREWSLHMGNTATLAHRTDLSGQVDARVTTEWTRIGENVGVGPDVASLHQAFMNSPGHRGNVLGDYNRVGVGVAVIGETVWVTFEFLKATPITGGTTTYVPAGPPPSGDLWMTTDTGDVYAYGSAPFYGSMGGTPLNRPIVGIAATPTGNGYWLVASDGGIFSFGDAGFYGSTGGMPLNQPIVGMASSPSGRGYWLVASDGGLFAFGDARFYGSTGSLVLNRPVLGMAPTPTGGGYWLVASDGGLFAFGDAGFFGSAGGTPISSAVTAMASSPSGRGYWMATRDGNVFSFGDAGFYGSAASTTSVTAPVTGIAISPGGGGYRLIGQDGRVYSFGDVATGASGAVSAARPIVGLAVKAR